MTPTKYSGHEWMESQVVEMSEFGKEVADILGQAYMGIYHIQDSVLNPRVRWGDAHGISIVIFGGLHSYDNNLLTRLLVLCFDRKVRLEINPRAFRYLELYFTKRTRRHSPNYYDRMPYLEDHIKKIRDVVGMEVLE